MVTFGGAGPSYVCTWVWGGVQMKQGFGNWFSGYALLFGGVGLAAALLVLVHGATQVRAANSGPRQPVLVELFTSEGCSSCPPADALLAELDAKQFVPGAEAIVLSEHVTYWDDLGGERNHWRDPFSSHALTQRQNDYANRLGLNEVYTPQAVVDGSAEFVGSNRAELVKAVEKAASRPKIEIAIENVRWSGDTVSADVSAAAPPHSALMVALADDSDLSSVLHGENEGRNLRHVAVVRSLVSVKKGAGVLSKVPVQIPMLGQGNAKMRLVVFLTDSGTGRVLGAAVQPVSR